MGTRMAAESCFVLNKVCFTPKYIKTPKKTSMKRNPKASSAAPIAFGAFSIKVRIPT